MSAPAATSTTDEHVLLRELANYKLLEPPTSSKLHSLREIHPWLKKFRSNFSRFPGVEQIIYSTVPATDEKTNYQAKAYPEVSVKIEGSGAAIPSKDKAALEFLTPDELTHLKGEMRSSGEVKTLPELLTFLQDSRFAKLIGEHPKLLAYVAPNYLKSGGNVKAPSVLEQHVSLEYERALVPATPVGYTVMYDHSGYVLPAQDRVAFGDGIVFLYYETMQPESKLHRTLRPYVWEYLVRSLTNTSFSHFITECKLKNDVSRVVQALIKKASSERYETEQSQAIMTFQMKLWHKDPKQSLQQWYSSAVDEAEEINEVSRTYKSEDLEIMTKAKINMMFKIHADAMGYRELSQRVARENGGLVPIDILIREIDLSDTIKSRDSLTDSFTARHSNVLRDKHPGDKQPGGGGHAPPPHSCELRGSLPGSQHDLSQRKRQGQGRQRRKRRERQQPEN